jgi:hypothetical protein
MAAGRPADSALSFRVSKDGRTLAAGLALSIASLVDPLQAQGPGTLKAVAFAVQGDHRRVVLELDGRVAYTLGRLSSPERLYLDLADTRPGPALRSGRMAFDDAVVGLIRVGQPRLALTRVVLDLNEAVEAEVSWMDGPGPPRLVVDLRRAGAARQAPPPVPSGAATAPPATPPPPSPAPAADAPAPSAATATPSPPAGSSRILMIPRVAVPPTLSDFLKGEAREAGARVDDFFQRTPGDGVPVSQPTSAYLSYDADTLYVVFVCAEDPGLVRGHMAKREVIGGDDRVSLYLDTFQDRRRAYVFSANPLGIQQDSISTEGQAEDSRFDTLWHARGRRTPDGYVVRMAIPFKSLRFPDRPVQTWGIALGRSIPRKNETAFWPHISRRVQSFIAQMGTLEGIEQVSPAHNVQVIPYGAFTRARLLGSGASYSTADDSRGGLDAKVVIRNAVTLDATVKPDFSQVESDDPQVTINQRFEVFFPEKRPFFLENAGFFQTPINLFFSRRIVDPELGGRLTGKMGGWALGLLLADDRAADRLLSAADPLRGRAARIGVFRLQREVGRQSTVGVLGTSRVFGSGLNQVVALDSRLKLGANWSFAGQIASSHERRSDGGRRDGFASYAQLLHGGQHLSYLGSYTDRSPGFRSQVGFIQRVDIRQTDHHVGYLWQPSGGRVVSFGPSVSGGGNWNRQGERQDWYATGDFSMDFAGPAGFNVSRYEAYELFLGTGFRHATTGASVYAGQLKWLSVSASVGRGTGINYSAPDPLSPYLGAETTATAAITLRPTSQLRVDQAYFFTRLATRPGSPPPGVAESGLIFRDHLWRTKINYQFSKAFSIRAILDYDDTRANPVLIAQSPFQRFRGDVLLTYFVQPGTALYVGYADRYDSVVVEPTTPPTLRVTGSPRTSTVRQFFVKVSYLFRY